MADESVERIKRLYRNDGEPLYKNEQLLKELYVERRMSTVAIAEELDCSSSTVSKYLKENGIEIRSHSEAIQEAYGTHGHAKYAIRKSGRACWKSKTDQVFVYRLLAVAEYGFEEVCDKVVHHKNGIKWDDRPENIELLTQSEHMTRHRKLSEEQQNRVVERYKSGKSSYDIAPNFDISPNTVIKLVREADPSAVRSKNDGGGADA